VALRVDGIDVGIRHEPLRQYLHQPPALEVTPDVPFGAPQDAVPVQRPFDRDLAVVGGQAAAGLDRLGDCLFAAAVGELPGSVGLFVLADADAVVPCQIAGEVPSIF
jgi:hypothetical protein